MEALTTAFLGGPAIVVVSMMVSIINLLSLKVILQASVRSPDNSGAHFWNIQTLQFRFRSNTLTDEPIHKKIEHKAQREDEAENRCHTHELGDKLAGIAIKQASDSSTNTVP